MYSTDCDPDGMTTRPFSYHVNRGKVALIPNTSGSYIYPVKVYDPKGNLKRTIPVEEIKNRPMGEGIFDYGRNN